MLQGRNRYERKEENSATAIQTAKRHRTQSLKRQQFLRHHCSAADPNTGARVNFVVLFSSYLANVY